MKLTTLSHKSLMKLLWVRPGLKLFHVPTETMLQTLSWWFMFFEINLCTFL